jgi:1-acyl-sn-glycerol-3-phosphate acyltransferase
MNGILLTVGVGFVALTMIIVWRAFACAEGWRPWVCYQVARAQARVFARWSATNACTFPEHGPAIIVANHTSSADPHLLWIRHNVQFQRPRLRVIRFLTAKEYYLQPGIVGWVCRAMKSIPVERSGHDMAALRDAFRTLDEGHLLGIFPEGKINATAPDERLLPGGTGVAWLALKSGAPVIPVFIHGAPRSANVRETLLKRSRTRLTYGEPIEFPKLKQGKPSHEILVENTNLIMQRLASMGGVEWTPVSDQNLQRPTASEIRTHLDCVADPDSPVG